jgi:hypothetical protein
MTAGLGGRTVPGGGVRGPRAPGVSAGRLMAGAPGQGATMSTRRGRGPAQKTLEMIEALIEIARPIQPCGVRALAYQMFIRHLILSMVTSETKKVSGWGVTAREKGWMPWEWVTDETRPEQSVPTWADPEAFARTVQHSYRRNKWADQPTHVSVWSEKSTIEGTIRPVMEKYEVPFQVLHGWSGATPVWDMASANLCRKQNTLILYICDYDPSGMYMSEMDLPKRLARYSTETPDDKDISPRRVRAVLRENRLEIRRIALTKADTRDLGPATRFAASTKMNDSRYEWFIRNHGRWCWELDAMSPKVLRDRLEAAIVAELDAESWDRYSRVEEAEREAIVATCQAWGSIPGPVPK